MIIPKRAVRGLKASIDALLVKMGTYDPVANPILLTRLSSYASIVAGQTVHCEWGKVHGTDLTGVVTLNPYDPPDAPPHDRKIVVDAALEHEIRGHWQFTPHQVFEVVHEMAAGRGPIACSSFWQEPERACRLQAVQILFNVLEDGRVETRLRWEQPKAYEVIAAADRIRPRWRARETYRAASKAYADLTRKIIRRVETVCSSCAKHSSQEGLPCQSCFTEQYRWEQITGILLLAALPPHTPPIEIVEPEVREALDVCLRWVISALQGTAQHTFEAAQEVLKILIIKQMVPRMSAAEHLAVSNAAGSEQAHDSPMSQETARNAGLDKEQEEQLKQNDQSLQSQSDSEPTLSDSISPKGTAQPQLNEQGSKQEQPDAQIKSQSRIPDANGNQSDTGDPEQMDHSKTVHQDNSSMSLVQNEKLSHSKDNLQYWRSLLEEIAYQDLKAYDFGVELDMASVRLQTQVELESVESERRADVARQLIINASGLGAGPGLDNNLRHVFRRRDIYNVLRQRNLERGRRFAREIEDLLSSVSQLQRFQRNGRLDRSQLVNAVARGRNTVFSRVKVQQQLDLVVSILVDVSGSMSDYNHSISPGLITPPHYVKPVQLADAVVICAIGLERLGVAFEVRAFGSYQWLVKGLYEQSCNGLGGLPGLDSGGTSMLPSVEYARLTLAGRQEGNQLMVIMTDGIPSKPQQCAAQIRLARLQGIRVLGVLFANGEEDRNQINPAMAQLFNPSGYTVIRSLEIFPHEVGRAIKNIVRHQVH